MTTRTPDSRRAVVLTIAAAAFVFVFAWFYRYNDPEGPLGGLTDDHYFYLARGWQMLFGDRLDRDFVDQGAPLTYVLEYWTQLLLGRGVWSEFAFCVSALAVGSALTCWVAARAAGSVAAGVAAALFATALAPRYYNYPKILVYALAIPALWSVADKPTWPRWALLAAITAAGFLWRHDHGIFVAIMAAVLLVLSTGWSWRTRVRYAALYAAMVTVLLAPYLVYLQVNGGIVRHFDMAARWASRDRARAPLVLPKFALTAAVFTQPPEGLDAGAEWWLRPPFSGFAANGEAWLFWLFETVPVAALALLLALPGANRSTWPRARLKMALVAVLAIVLNVGFLRGRLAARVADVAVPQAILAAWILALTIQIGWRGIGARGTTVGLPLRIVVGLAGAFLVVVTTLVLLPGVRETLEAGDFMKGPGYLWRKAASTTTRMKANARLEGWAGDGYQGPVKLSYYLRDCTSPDDRVLVSPYYPMIAPLANRAFAGGQVDLRADFFDTVADQQLTRARLERQAVPVVIMDVGAEQASFEQSLPILNAYLRDRYTVLGDRDLGGGHVVSVWVDKRVSPVGRYAPLDLPCFR